MYQESRSIIVPTHMLESMILAPDPTRSEVSDVANAVLEKTDAIMGVRPFEMAFSKNPEDTIKHSLDYLKRQKWVKDGQALIVISNALAQDKIIDTLKIRTVESI